MSVIQLRYTACSVLLFIVGCTSLFTQSLLEDANDQTCRLIDLNHNYRLVNYVEFLIDSSDALTIEEVTRPAFQNAFRPYYSNKNERFTNRWYWGKVSVSSQLSAVSGNTQWVFSFPTNWTTLDIYTPNDNGGWTREPNGTFLALGKKHFRPTAKANFTQLSIPNGASKTIYFRGKGERRADPLSFNIYVQSAEFFYDKLSWARVGNAIFIGFLGMMFLYNLFVYFFGRDRSFIYYCGYLLMMILYAAYSNDDLVDWFSGWLFTEHPQYYGFFKLSIFAGLTFYLAFIREFLHLDTLLPAWERYLKPLTYLGILLMALHVVVALYSNFSHVLEDRISVPYIALVIGSCMLLLYPLFKTGDKRAYFIFAGIAAISIGAILTILSRVVFPPFSIFYLKLGVIIEVLTFSLGLAYRQKKQVQEKERADFALRENKLILEKQEMEADRQRELTEFKTRFFTNITHELRTPLTVIMGMIEQIKDHPKEKELLRRNGKNLLELINQLLELSKLDAGQVSLTLTHGDIIPYLRYLTESFHSAAERKNIRFMFYAEEQSLLMDFDEGKLLQIINNLLANALKFTPERGQIIVHASKLSLEHGDLLKVVVKDDGIGIAPEHVDRVFDRFYQVETKDKNTAAGSGVGLALTRELVEMMQGEITLSSRVGKGTEFVVNLPIKTNLKPAEPAPLAEVLSTNNGDDTDRPEILIVEDNKDIIVYLETLLAQHYILHRATNGTEGIALALELVPDIILSDVMMPGKNGYEVCNTLKADERTSHIPIILLTAKDTQEARIEGLRYGADAYLTKPFNQEELAVRIDRLIDVRRQLQLRYQNNAETRDNGSALGLADVPKEDPLIAKLHGLLQDHLDDSHFGVSELAAAANLSPTQLYRKIKAVTGKTPSRFMRSYRLNRAVELLRAGQLNISEIAYTVGFADPSYFSRTFQEEFRSSPSDFLKN